MQFPATQATLHTLPNGLTLILDPDASAPVISAQAWVETGSQHESLFPGAGLSHLLEHMLFKGTKSYDTAQLATTVQAAGGHWNAYTTFDRTVYYIDGPAHSSDTFTKVLFEMIFQPRFPKDDFETERDVIRREIDMGLDDPGDLSSHLLFQTAYQSDLRRYPVIGHLDLFNALTYDDMVNYHHSRYTPENTFFAFSGDFDPQELIQQIEQLIKEDNTPRPFTHLPTTPEEPAQLGPRSQSVNFDTATAKLALTWKTPGLAHPDTVSLELLSSILGGGRSSLLFATLREKENLTHAISSWNWSTADTPGLFSISAEVDLDKKDQLNTRILELIATLTLEQISTALPKVKRQITTTQLRTLATASGRASDLASNWHEARNLNFTRDYLLEIEKITPEQILQAAQTYLIEKTLTTTSVDPLSEKNETSTAEKAASSNPISTHTLSNGLRLVIREDHRIPTLNFALAFQGGLLNDSPDTSGLTSQHAANLLKGTSSRSSQEIATQIESLGAKLNTSSGNNSTLLTAFCLSDDLNELLTLTSDILLNPTFPQEHLNQSRESTLAAIKENALDPLKLAFRTSRQTLFGNSGYGLSKLGTQETLATFTSQHLLDYHQKHLVAKNGVLSISGDLNPQKVITLAESTLGKLPTGTPSSAAAPSVNIQPNDLSLTLEKEQAALVISYAGHGIHSNHLPALNLLNEYTADMAGPLFTRIREELGLAYYVSATQFHGLGNEQAGYFAFYLGTSPDQIKLARTEMEKEIAKLTTELIDKDTLDAVKATFLASEAMQNQSNGSMAQSYALNELFNLGINHSKEEIEKTKALTPTDLQKTAQLIFQNPTIITVTPHSK